jgi:hypothetical protein
MERAKQEEIRRLEAETEVKRVQSEQESLLAKQAEAIKEASSKKKRDQQRRSLLDVEEETGVRSAQDLIY